MSYDFIGFIDRGGRNYVNMAHIVSVGVPEPTDDKAGDAKCAVYLSDGRIIYTGSTVEDVVSEIRGAVEHPNA